MEQGNLKLHRKQEDIPLNVVRKCKDLRSVIRLSIESSGLSVKEVAFELAIQENHLSRMISGDGDRHFPPELLNKLMDVTGNEAPLQWLALSRNYRLERLKEAWEIENERLRALLEEGEKERQMMLRLVREIKA